MDIALLNTEKTRFITREVQVTIGDEVLNAVVRPLGITMATQAKLFHFDEVFASDHPSSNDIEASLDAFPRALAELVVEWDLMVDGTEVTPTYESIRELPMDVVQLLMTSIQEEANATPLEETSTS